jgi:hypothetical protein
MLALPLVPNPARAQGKPADGLFAAIEDANLMDMAVVHLAPTS